jgi:hypothetical protein
MCRMRRAVLTVRRRGSIAPGPLGALAFAALLQGCPRGSPVVRPGRDASRELGSDVGRDALGTMDGPVRCVTDGDCASNPSGRVCDAPSGACVECLAPRDTCAPTHHCDPERNTCRPGCRADEGCQGARSDAGGERRGRTADASRSSLRRPRPPLRRVPRPPGLSRGDALPRECVRARLQGRAAVPLGAGLLRWRLRLAPRQHRPLRGV